MRMSHLAKRPDTGSYIEEIEFKTRPSPTIRIYNEIVVAHMLQLVGKTENLSHQG